MVLPSEAFVKGIVPLIIPGPPPPGNGARIPLAPGGSPPRGAP